MEQGIVSNILLFLILKQWPKLASLTFPYTFIVLLNYCIFILIFSNLTSLWTYPFDDNSFMPFAISFIINLSTTPSFLRSFSITWT